MTRRRPDSASSSAPSARAESRSSSAVCAELAGAHGRRPEAASRADCRDGARGNVEGARLAHVRGGRRGVCRDDAPHRDVVPPHRRSSARGRPRACHRPTCLKARHGVPRRARSPRWAGHLHRVSPWCSSPNDPFGPRGGRMLRGEPVASVPAHGPRTPVGRALRGALVDVQHELNDLRAELCAALAAQPATTGAHRGRRLSQPGQRPVSARALRQRATSRSPVVSRWAAAGPVAPSRSALGVDPGPRPMTAGVGANNLAEHATLGPCARTERAWLPEGTMVNLPRR